ncbi:hypothetical protein Tco_0054013 [Tanacetum coccineum]
MAIGTGHRSNNYSESKRNDHLDNNRRQEQRNKGELYNRPVERSGDAKQTDCIVLDGMERSILAKICWGTLGMVGIRIYGSSVKGVKTSKALNEDILEFKVVSQDLIQMKECLDRPGGRGLPNCIMGSRGYKKLGGIGGKHAYVCGRVLKFHFVIDFSFIATEFAYWCAHIERLEVNSESNHLERKDEEGPRYGFCERWMFVGGKWSCGLHLKKGDFVMILVLYSDGAVLRIAWKRTLEDDAGGDSWSSFLGCDCVKCLPLMIMRMLRQLSYCPVIDSVFNLRLHYTPGNDLNIAVGWFFSGLFILVL